MIKKEELDFEESIMDTSFKTIDEFVLQKEEDDTLFKTVDEFLLRKEVKKEEVELKDASKRSTNCSLSEVDTSDNELIRSLINHSSKRLKTENPLFKSVIVDLRKTSKQLSAVPNHPTIKSFIELDIKLTILNSIHKMKVDEPTKLQKIFLPKLIGNQKDDLFFKSKPFAGKKYAYLISSLNRIDTSIDCTQVLILGNYDLI